MTKEIVHVSHAEAANDFDAKDLLPETGPIDGQKFFTRSPFKSVWFLIISLICLAGIVLDVLIVFQNWQKLSADQAIFLLGMANGGLAAIWYRAFRYHDRIGELIEVSHFRNAPAGSPSKLLLSAAAWGMIDILFFCSSTIFFLLLIIDFLLARVAPH